MTASSTLSSISSELAATVERASPAVVAVNARTRIAASGIHWREGIVVTAEHTLKRDEEITVSFADGRSGSATLVGRDPGSDLAVLRVADLPEATTPFAAADSLKVGHLVLAIARPGEGGPSASLGTVSTISGPWRTWRGGQIDRLIRLDLNFYPGFSGGALVDTAGQIVGLTTAGLSRSAVVAVPVSTIERTVDQLLATGRIARGYLGIGMQPVRLPDALKAQLNLAGNGGVIVVNLEHEGPAERSGVLIGDVLVAIDGTTIDDTDDVLALLSPERVGKSVPVQAVRGGQPVALTITIGERPRRGG
ncbi:S1C family serine protease [Gloeobacter kilaueensis]|uniref:Serine protease n=1 Tax=Gloeobacter kilaueensis (strain ATCC BAA-2537 / CCAP 1431/1 / ULC 316 / JS1) TaxID=1183438 RepID=U5QEF0_GLOK1|nr:S1C family serine protease [Gloeobacter kilaueensis]AGY57258.1 serine protease [Gloeobacter kilaueensis JS1]